MMFVQLSSAGDALRQGGRVEKIYQVAQKAQLDNGSIGFIMTDEDAIEFRMLAKFPARLYQIMEDQNKWMRFNQSGPLVPNNLWIELRGKSRSVFYQKDLNAALQPAR